MSNKPMFTPGPWGNHLVDDTVVVIPRRPNQQEISVLGNSEVADDEDYANARLIAAAPELIAVAENLIAWVDGKDQCTSDIEQIAIYARAVIAKATGVTHE